MTWILPDRFNDNELSLEAIHTAINLLSAFHDSITQELDDAAPALASELSFALTALQQIEVLVELWGSYAERKRTIANSFDPIIVVEGLKYVRLCPTALLRTEPRM